MTNPISPLTPSQTATQEASTAKEGYLHRVAVSVDQTANVVTGGKPDETISSRAAIADEQGKWWGRAMSRFLDLFQSDHGAKAQAGDTERAQAEVSREQDSGGISTSTK